jgi:chemotaxis response regulator CheB
VAQIGVASGIPPLIAVGGSREGLSALIDLVAGLPRWLSASVVACLDMPELTGASLISALRANTDWRVQWVQGGDRVMRRHVHVVMPGRVAIVDRHGNFRTLPQSAPAQPRVDQLFASVARVCHQRCVGVLLGGELRDGTHGARKVARAGGAVIAQDTVRVVAASGALDALSFPASRIAATVSALIQAPGAMSWFRVRPAARAIQRPGPAGAGRRPGAEGD